MAGGFKCIGINFSGLIQEIVVKERIPFVFLLRKFNLKIMIKLQIGLVIQN